MFVLDWDRETLNERIDRRVERMFADGLVEEVRGLLERQPPLSRTASQAVGYREVIEHLAGGPESGRDSGVGEDAHATVRQASGNVVSESVGVSFRAGFKGIDRFGCGGGGCGGWRGGGVAIPHPSNIAYPDDVRHGGRRWFVDSGLRGTLRALTVRPLSRERAREDLLGGGRGSRSILSLTVGPLRTGFGLGVNLCAVWMVDLQWWILIGAQRCV